VLVEPDLAAPTAGSRVVRTSRDRPANIVAAGVRSNNQIAMKSGFAWTNGGAACCPV